MAWQNHIRGLVVVVITIGIATAHAEPPKADRPKKDAGGRTATTLNTGQEPAATTIERIMEQAVRNIAARYNLNDNQTEITRKLMSQGVHRFLKEHEAEVWPAIRGLLGAQLGTTPPENKDEVKRIGRTIRPLAKLAREAIFQANAEWREMLTPEQKKVHDFDLAEMGNQFEQMDKNLADWESGRPTDKGIFPPPNLGGDKLRRPSRPPDVPPERNLFDLNILEALVEAFIKEHQLDEGQITSARSILEEFKSKANDYRTSKKADFARILAEREEAYTHSDLQGIKKASAAHKSLLRPVYELCAQMEHRLEGLLTSIQLQRHADQRKTDKETSESVEVTTEKTPKKNASPVGSRKSNAPS